MGQRFNELTPIIRNNLRITQCVKHKLLGKDYVVVVTAVVRLLPAEEDAAPLRALELRHNDAPGYGQSPLCLEPTVDHVMLADDIIGSR
jgi:hypothetical protein